MRIAAMVKTMSKLIKSGFEKIERFMLCWFKWRLAPPVRLF